MHIHRGRGVGVGVGVRAVESGLDRVEAVLVSVGQEKRWLGHTVGLGPSEGGVQP